MKFSRNWLAEFVAIDESSAAFAERLTMAGLEVDRVEALASLASSIVVARIETAASHPRAQNLRVCEVDVGSGANATVVCGAPNARAGLLSLLALPGTTLADGREIAARDLRGTTSHGMLCSYAELDLGEEADRIVELAADLTPGTSANTLIELPDTIFEVGLTPNRGDCLSLWGLAREYGALTDQLVSLPTPAPIAAHHEETFAVELLAPEACPCYAGRVIRDICAGRPTPLWLRERLRRAGVRAINAVVDVTNYVMLELGQPLHAFDLSTLEGGIRVRYADADERLQLLDGEELGLNARTLVIADHQRPVALAGIMGGLASGVEQHSQDIFLESAFFEPVEIAGVARQHRLHTDASHRFERGVDGTGQGRAIERASALLLEICGGRPGPTIVTQAAAHGSPGAVIAFDPGKVAELLGVTVPASRCGTILESLGLRVERASQPWRVTPPPWRFDLRAEVDLIEEIARLVGYGQIPRSLPDIAPTPRIVAGPLTRARAACEQLTAYGFYEAITYSFIASEKVAAFTPGTQAPVLRNPIASDMAVMRPSLWPGLIDALAYNCNRQRHDLRLFEIGRIFRGDAAGGQQRHVLAGVATGAVLPGDWGGDRRELDFFDLKHLVVGCLNALGIAAAPAKPAAHPALHPGQAAALTVASDTGPITCATLGLLHPRLARSFELPESTWLFEIDLEALPPAAATSFTPLSRFPSVRRDIDIVVDESVAAVAVQEAVSGAAKGLLRDLQLFDVYRGQGIDSGKKSLSLGLIFQAASSTLTDSEVDDAMAEVLNAIALRVGGTLRN